MSRTLRVTDEGASIADHARRRKGWTKSSLMLCEEACTSARTLRRFWAGEAISKEHFIYICEALEVNWKDICIESSNLSPKKWTIHIEISGIDYEILQKIAKHICKLLKRYSGDSTLQLSEVKRGSIILLLEGTLEGYERIEYLFSQNQLDDLLDEHILSVELEPIILGETDEISRVAKVEIESSVDDSISTDIPTSIPKIPTGIKTNTNQNPVNNNFVNLIKRFSQLQYDSNEISTEEIASLFSKDPELLKAYIADNFEKSHPDNKRLQKRILLLSAVLLGLAIPFSVLGGYKLREFAATRFSPLNPEQDALMAELDSQSKKLESLESDNAKLNQMVQDKDDRIGELIKQIATQPESIDPGSGQTAGSVEDDPVEASASSGSKTGTPPRSADEVGANTSSGSILQAGQTWAQDGIVMTLTDPSVKSQCKNGLVQFNLTLSNFSGKDQIVKFSGDDLAIDVDNAFSSNYSWSTNAAARNNCNTYNTNKASNAGSYLIPRGSLEIEDLEDGETVELYVTFFGELESYDQVIKFHLEKAGPIEKAKWLINGPRD